MPTHDLMKLKQPVQLNMDGLSAMAVFSNLILSLKHPANTGPKRVIVLDLVELIGGELVRLGILTGGEVRDTMKRAHYDGHMDLVDRLQRVAAGAAPQAVFRVLE